MHYWPLIVAMVIVLSELGWIIWSHYSCQDQPKEPMKSGSRREYCSTCGGQLVVSMPNGQKPRNSILIHLDNGSIRCPVEVKYFEPCGFPIGSPYRGGYSKRCKLPIGHAPSSACSIFPLPTTTSVCPHCERTFTLVSNLVCRTDGPGMIWDSPQLPVHDLPETPYTPIKKHWYKRTIAAPELIRHDRRCPGSPDLK